MARQVAGLTLTDLSGRTGLSKGYLSKLEAGVVGAANPSRATLAALARALPGFRPIAHTLEPGLSASGLAFDGVAREVSAAPSRSHAADAPMGTHATQPLPPVQLGWRDLEVLAALVTLEAAALPLPITLVVLARAVGRTRADIFGPLERLMAADMVAVHPPVRAGGPETYRCAVGAAERIGVARVGDLLLLAAALLAGAPPPAGTARTLDHDRCRELP
jgi:transcriptional regulator with XRE-family HTH domain